jgi:hypothetical protein
MKEEKMDGIYIMNERDEKYMQYSGGTPERQRPLWRHLHAIDSR